MAKTRILTDIDALMCVQFAQLVALRWDIIPWSIVLDLNYAVSENKTSTQHRGWLIFRGVSELSWELKNSRLPNGLIISGPIRKSLGANGFNTYLLPHLAPQFDSLQQLQGDPRNILTIVAQSCSGLVSLKTMDIDTPWLSYKQRNSLASDDDFLAISGD